MNETKRSRGFPKGIRIDNIRRGGLGQESMIYATLLSPEGEPIISATLSYIVDRVLSEGIEK